MSIILHEVAFHLNPPDPQRVADEIRSRTGLAVAVTESKDDAAAALYSSHAQLAFASEPDERIAVYTLRPGLESRRYEIAFVDDDTLPARLPGPSRAPASDLPNARAVVYIKGSWKREPTLFVSTQLALERLGGVSTFPLTEQQRGDCDRLLTADEIGDRRRRWRQRLRYGRVLQFLLLPVTIPLTLLKWLVVAIVPGVWKLGRGVMSLGRGRTQ
jgi:hypothetical protein